MLKCFFSHRVKALALALAAVLTLHGCGARPVEESMPYIAPQYPPLRHQLRVALYFPKADGTYASEIHLISLDGGKAPEVGVAEALINGPAAPLLPVVLGDVRLNHAYIVQDTAYVDVSLSQQQTLSAFTRALALTLNEAFDVAYLVLTVDGHVPEGAQRGVEPCMPKREETPLYFQIYFPEADGEYIIPLVRHIAMPPGTSMVGSIFGSLKDGPLGTDLQAALDEEGDITLDDVRIADRTLNLYLSVPDQGRIAHDGYACIAMSMLRNVPGVRAVRIHVNGERVRDVPGANDAGLFTVASMADMLGGFVTLYFAGADGHRLTAINRAVAQRTAAAPLTALEEILRGPHEAEKTGLMNVFPADIKVEDILSLRRHNDLAVLDLSSAFYQACEGLTEDAERLLIYAIVNAITERKDINKVLFMNEGTNVETLSGAISLQKPLIRNPGLIMLP